MYKAYRFRLYPNDKQKELIHKIFGCTRFIYNYFLNQLKYKHYVLRTKITLSKLI